ncbi:MAG: hypothetical protein O7C39_03080, partial [Bacteroidetes bacterium]|nr:hypothetical protein [Bacteroidota bacterium]
DTINDGPIGTLGKMPSIMLCKMQLDQLIRRLQRNLGLTVFMVTHDLDSLSAICDRIAVLAEQRVLVVGSGFNDFT